MTITIRQELPSDYQAVFQVIEAAFKPVEFSDHQEHFLVERLRKSNAFIPSLSLVAKNNHQILGHIILTKIHIRHANHSFDSLALAPVSVLPSFQQKGIGKALILEAHKVAKSLGFKSIVVVGHEDYYPKFGYQLTSQFGIQLPFEAPEKNCMVIELIKNGLQGVSGMVEYDKAFFE